MNGNKTFKKLAELPKEELRGMGAEFTVLEIASQPDLWRKTTDLVIRKREELKDALSYLYKDDRSPGQLVLTGAGTSEHIGNAVRYLLQKNLGLHVDSIPTTHLTTHAESMLNPLKNTVLISFARSGNSPESMAAFQALRRRIPEARHLVVTCNPDGRLAKCTQDDENAYLLVLPEGTNDNSLAMTASFSSMALAALGLGFLDKPDIYRRYTKYSCSATEALLEQPSLKLSEIVEKNFNRAVFLGSGALFGTMQEAALKMQELTNGRVATIYNSFLGIRHGPQAFIDENCLIFASVSDNHYVRKYEVDLLNELEQKNQGCCTLCVAGKFASTEIGGASSAAKGREIKSRRGNPPSPGGEDRGGKTHSELDRLADYSIELYDEAPPADSGIEAESFRIFTDVAAAQMLSTLKSMQLGIQPDNPSPEGRINRVVKGVTIYPFP